MTNAHNSEPVVPAKGRFASFTVWIENLPSDCDLIGLDVRVGGEPATPCYIGPPESDGLQQLNVLLREVPRTGVLRLEILWNGDPVCEPASLRVIPARPAGPACDVGHRWHQHAVRIEYFFRVREGDH